MTYLICVWLYLSVGVGFAVFVHRIDGRPLTNGAITGCIIAWPVFPAVMFLVAVHEATGWVVEKLR